VLQLLDSSSPAVQLQAAAALEKLCADADNAHCLATLGAAPRLVTLLSSSSFPLLQTAAANVLRQLAGTSPLLKEAVVGAGAVRALAHLLCSGADIETGTAAAAALGCIAAGSATHKKTVATVPSAISGLVGLLHSGDTAAVEAATATLRSLSSADAGGCLYAVSMNLGQTSRCRRSNTNSPVHRRSMCQTHSHLYTLRSMFPLCIVTQT
jgi:hypothetical protein